MGLIIPNISYLRMVYILAEHLEQSHIFKRWSLCLNETWKRTSHHSLQRWSTCLSGIQQTCPRNIFGMLFYAKLNSQHGKKLFFDLTKFSLKKVHHNYCWLLMTFFFSYLAESILLHCRSESLWCLKGHILESKVPDTYSPKPVSLKTSKHKRNYSTNTTPKI